MNAGQFCVWIAVLAIVSSPWFVATIIAWIYYEVFPEPIAATGSGQDVTIASAAMTESQGGNGMPNAKWIIAIIQTCSGFIYVLYILFGILWVGCFGRASLCSFCCIALGIPIFGAIPAGVGIFLLVDALTRNATLDSIGQYVGVATAVCCFLSTVFCIMVTLVALICGSKGRGRKHRFPIPLAYLPCLKEFEEYEDTDNDDSNNYTSDYPPPLRTPREKRPSTASNGGYGPSSSSKVSLSSVMPEAQSRKTLDADKRNGSYSTSNPPPYKNRSTGNTDNKRRVSSISLSGYPRPSERKTSTASASSSTKGRGHKQSVESDTGHTFAKHATKYSHNSLKSLSVD